MGNNIDFKKKLEDELALLEEELQSVGRKNPDNEKDWEARSTMTEILPNDEEEVADKLESYDTNNSILTELEIRYNEVKKALEKINSGKGYGICEVCGEAIDPARLEANPAATTCIKHMKH